jgi:hypothetical protein
MSTKHETLLQLVCMLPLLEQFNQLIKFSQSRNIIICDFVTALCTCQAQLFTNYQDDFYGFNILTNLNHDDSKLSLNTKEEHLVFE